MLQRRAAPAKRYLRRTLQIIAFVGTLIVGMIALALIVSQTPWFRDWLRRFVVSESKQYLNGNLSIGSLGGDLFYGVRLGDIALEVNGERIVTLKQLEIKYSIAELISQGITVRQIRLEQPYVRLRHDASGWNIASVIKRQAQEADRQGPWRPVSLPDIEIVDGGAAIDDKAPADSYRVPSKVDGLNVKGGFEYAPVHYSLTIDNLSVNGRAPNLAIQRLAGRIGTREDTLHVEKLSMLTPQSSVTIDGVVRDYLKTPSVQVTVSAPKLSLPEFSGVLPGLRGYDLHPALSLKASGPQDRLELTIDEKSEAGSVTGSVVADLQTPDLAARGDLNVQHLNLAPLLQNPDQKSDITGHAVIDLKVASAPASASTLDRMRGRFAFQGPQVVAAGYHASDVKGRGEIAGRRISFDGRANAYGGSATAKGFIVTPARSGGAVLFDIAGRASHVDLRNLPATLKVPRLATDVNASAYHVKGQSGNVEGTATLDASTVEDAKITPGTTAEFGVEGKAVRYAAKGGVREANLGRLGRALQIDALSKPEYESRLNAEFEVRGRGTSVDALVLDAQATLNDSQILGGTMPHVVTEAHLANGGLNGRANGEFRGFDPARLTGKDSFKGEINGTVDAAFGLRNVSAPVTADDLTADGRVTLTPSNIGGVRIDSADIQGRYADQRGDLRQATVKSPDFDLQASGPIALDRAGNSNLKYHVAATNLEAIGRIFDQPVGGSAVIDGTLTGNGDSLKTTGTLNGSNLSYQDNKALDLDSTFTVTVPDLTFAKAQVQAETTGSFVEAGGMQINELKATTTYAEKKLDFQAHVAQAPSGGDAEKAAGLSASGLREVDATGTVIFHPDHQEIHLPRLAIRTQGVEWKTVPGSQMAVQYASNRIQLHDVQLVNGTQTLDMSGSFSLGENTAPGSIDVRAANVDLAQLEKLMLQNRGLTGTLNANARITGTAKAPAVEGHADIASGAFQKFKYQSLTANANYSADRVILDARLVQTPGVELTAKGTVPMSALRPNPPDVTGHIEGRPGDELDLAIQSSRIDLGIVQGFTNQLTNVTGTLQVDARVTGSGEDPHLNGYVDIQNGAFGVVPTGVAFKGLTTRIELQPDRIHVPRLQILDQHGQPMTIEGDLAVHEREAGAVNVSIESNDFKVIDNELGNVHLESHLKLTGEVRRPRLVGDIRFDSARLELDRILPLLSNPYSVEALPDVVSAQEAATTEKGADQAARDAFQKGRQLSSSKAEEQNATAAKAPAPEAGAMAALALDLHVVAPDNLVLRGSDLRPGGPTAAKIGNVNATVGADLQVQKDPGGPVLLRGTANTVRGFYEFQGRRFELVRDGTVKFLGLPQINPDVDVTAGRLIPNTGVLARVHITGTLRAPELTLTSDPPLDEADILSLIVFNRSVNELGTGERASLAETAAGVASGFIAAPLGKSIGQALDVDLFEITTSDPVTGETAGGVTLGKQIGDKAFVRFRQQFGQRSYTEFMLEYQLAKFLRLQTTVAPETAVATNRLTQRRIERGGLDLIFFFSY